jgi:CHASE2 domain-containing sensor protein
MAKLVVIKLMQGNFENGFDVTLQIGEDGAAPTTEINGYLPPAPEIDQYYKSWQIAHRSTPLRIKPKQKQIKNVSLGNSANVLSDSLKNWLNESKTFRSIREKMYEKLQVNDNIRVLLRTPDTKLWQLPWHLWDFFERYPLAELAVSTTVYDQIPTESKPHKKVRILAILGDSTDIDIEADRNLLENLQDAETVFLVEPSVRELNDQLWDDIGWDILFFAGHSRTEGATGSIDINSNESLKISQLENAFQKAISRGLQLAIFNSCDGLGLAQQLASLHIPQVIVMREPVPDKVAQEFLKYFLISFSGGQPLYLAVREARERLQGLENQFPYASWLPVIYQNLIQAPPTWEELKGIIKQHPIESPVTTTSSVIPPVIPPPVVRRASIKNPLFISVMTATLVMLLRSFGLLQFLELKTFDQMLSVRRENPDNRIAMVVIDGMDVKSEINNQEKSGQLRSLSDNSLRKLLQILKQNPNILAGLSLYLKNEKDSIPKDILTSFQNMENLIGVCKEASLNDSTGVSPPPTFPPENMSFSDVIKDRDGVIRRQIVFMSPEKNSSCQAEYSLSSLLVIRYLYNLPGQAIEPTFKDQKYLQLGKTVIKSLKQTNPGFYYPTDFGGSQILINYRSSDIERIRLSDLLKKSYPIDKLKNKILLIGATHGEFDKDEFKTPDEQKASPVYIQAQMTSQILSAVLDGRPLLFFWSLWADILWVSGWSLVSGISVWFWRKPQYQVIAVGSSSIILYAVGCGFLFLQGAVVPIVPTFIAIVLCGGMVNIFTVFPDTTINWRYQND